MVSSSSGNSHSHASSDFLSNQLEQASIVRSVQKPTGNMHMHLCVNDLGIKYHVPLMMRMNSWPALEQYSSQLFVVPLHYCEYILEANPWKKVKLYLHYVYHYHYYAFHLFVCTFVHAA